MSILTVEKMSHSFGGRIIFEDVSFRLLKGEHIGLVGANGEGKSTFMNIITNKLKPEEGKVTWSNKVKVGFLDQNSTLQDEMSIYDVLKSAFIDLVQLENDIAEAYNQMMDLSDEEMDQLLEKIGNMQEHLEQRDYYNLDQKINEVASAFDLLHLDLDTKVSNLSGGQRVRVLIAKLLLEKPDILLLDEPTNYLDENHISWLKNYLKEYENAFILISHDIDFMNDVINVVYHVEAPMLTRYKGDYNEFRRIYEINKAQMEKAYERQNQEIAKLEDFIARNKARVATRGMANSRAKKLDKMERIEIKGEKPKNHFNFIMGKTPHKIIVETNELVLGYTTELCKPINMVIEKGEKIALVGANGLGKTTLLKTLMGTVNPFKGNCDTQNHLSIGYFEQEEPASDLSVIDELWREYPSFSQYEIRKSLAKCGLTNDQIESKVKVLSGGERAKLKLAKLMYKEHNVLFLDEPFNHLDQDAKEELVRALKEYSGTIVIVSHEPEFYRQVVDKIVNLEEYTLKRL